MSELSLVGLHDDGEHVVLEGPDGQRFRLAIDDALRAAVRRDRPQLEQVRAELTGVLPPRQIQALIRAGATAEQVAQDSGMPVEIVRRYEGPVLAEREWVADQARSSRIGRDAGAPTLGDLVTDRLATRGVDRQEIRWDAARPAGEPWAVSVTFEIGGDARVAGWTYEQATRSVRATDDEARWLSETELTDTPIPRRHLAAVRSTVFDIEVDDALRPVLAAVDGAIDEQHPAPEPDPTDALLADLNDRRGVRQPLEEDDEEDSDVFEGFGPQHAFDFDHPGLTTPDVPAAHPPASRPDLAVDATVLHLPSADRQGPSAATGEVGAPDQADEPTAPRPRTRKGRASVPSWDEIVFGAKPE